MFPDPLAEDRSGFWGRDYPPPPAHGSIIWLLITPHVFVVTVFPFIVLVLVEVDLLVPPPNPEENATL